MFEVKFPEAVAPETLDRRMAEGWFRAGPLLFRTNVIGLEGAIRGLVHVRLPLADDVQSRSRRRLLRRNRDRFRVEIGPARIDDARRRLYGAMKPRFLNFVASDVEPLVLGDGSGVFDTRECAVYAGDHLVAVSYFDVGSESVASQLGLHDPEYARDSLGFYTLLEEIEYARAIGGRFFYPGYVVPGVPGFDYKLRIGSVQYLEGSRWRRRSQPPRQVRGAERYAHRIRALERALEREDVAFWPRSYPAFWLGYLESVDPRPFLRGLIHLQLGKPGENTRLLVIDFAPEDEEFQLYCARVAPELDVMKASTLHGPTRARTSCACSSTRRSSFGARRSVKWRGSHATPRCPSGWLQLFNAVMGCCITPVEGVGASIAGRT